uniref:Acyltransferase C-terminal domain-containing protein n=1 Tax=Plectus sambesii TaxID=2011161 RepID=A0A914VH91_9BILA
MAWKGGYAPFIDDMFGSYRSPQKTHLLYRVYKVNEVSTESEETVRDWFYDRWVEKDQLLDDFYKTGEFAPSYDQNRGRKVEYSTFECLTAHVFWIGLFCVHMLAVSKVFSCLFL